MHKSLIVLLACLITVQSFGQQSRKLSAFLQTQYTQTLYDYTRGNNPWGWGLGLQAFVNTPSKFRPTAELTGDLYLEDDKVNRSNPDGSFPENGNDVRGMVNLFVGSSFHPKQNVYVSLTAGPSFISGQIYFGIKPSVGFYFSSNQKWTGKVSYINIFNRTKMVNEDFGSISVAIGLRLF